MGLVSDDKRQAMEHKKILTVNSSVQRSSTARGTFSEKQQIDGLHGIAYICERRRLNHVGIVRCTGIKFVQSQGIVVLCYTNY